MDGGVIGFHSMLLASFLECFKNLVSAAATKWRTDFERQAGRQEWFSNDYHSISYPSNMTLFFYIYVRSFDRWMMWLRDDDKQCDRNHVDIQIRIGVVCSMFNVEYDVRYNDGRHSDWLKVTDQGNEFSGIHSQWMAQRTFLRHCLWQIVPCASLYSTVFSSHGHFLTTPPQTTDLRNTLWFAHAKKDRQANAVQSVRPIHQGCYRKTLNSTTNDSTHGNLKPIHPTTRNQPEGTIQVLLVPTCTLCSFTRLRSPSKISSQIR